ncbi:MAG TPA: glycosyltransferase family 39 protein, partial [Gemmatimonadaceae bacterium]|nr:glycosyltransferase family 39 protein [Gemmatimonadaceae bacterium]
MRPEAHAPPPAPEPAGERVATLIAAAAIILGVAARGWAVAHRGSLFLDEASLALNVLSRGFVGLTRPLAWGQAAPVGYLWIERAAVNALGASEVALRAWPFVAGAATLPFTWLVARRIAGPWPAAFATVAVSCSLLGTRYASEAKPYASDALVAIGLAWLALRVLDAGVDAPRARGRWWLLGACGAVAVVVSLPAVFVLGATGVAVGAAVWVWRDAGARRAALACAVAWIAVFAVVWLGGIRGAAHAAYLQEYWAPVMLQPGRPALAARVVRAIGSVAATPLWWEASVAFTLAAVAAWAVGAVRLARRNRVAAVLVVGPVALAAAASMLGVYPLSDRLAYFAAPLGMIAVGVALDAVAGAVGAGPVSATAGGAARGAVATTLRALVALALGAGVGADAWHLIRAPGALEPTHDLFASVAAEARATHEPVYV